MSRRGIGQFGEEQACLFLKRHAFLIVDRNFYTRFGEIDIIAYDQYHEQLAFVEVKTRQGVSAPEYAITQKKRQNMHKAAWCFMKYHCVCTEDYRFDSIAVIIDRSKRKIRIRHCKALTVY